MGQHRFIAERVTRAQIEQIAQDYLERYQPECVGYEVKPVNVVRLLDTDLWTEKRVGFHPVDSLPDPVEGWFDFLKARVELTFVDLEGIEKETVSYVSLLLMREHMAYFILTPSRAKE